MVDLETIRVYPVARLIASAVIRSEPAGRPVVVTNRANHGGPISPAAAAAHGLTDAAATAAPPFPALARGLANQFAGCNLAAYHAGFDLAVLAAEFGQAWAPLWVAGRAVPHPLAEFRRHEPRTLSTAVAPYLGRKHGGAHSALSDAAKAAVRSAQVPRYEFPQDLAGVRAELVEVDVAGLFRRSPDGRPASGSAGTPDGGWRA